MVKIVTWNVNSIKSRIVHLIDYVKSYDPDIVLLQELKCVEEAVPRMEIEDLGYNVAISGQKTYNGVAILSKYPMDDIITSLPGDTSDEQARYIEAVISYDDTAFRVASVYVPNGQTPGSEKFHYKMKFFDRLYHHTKSLLSLNEIMVIGGDYNVAPDTVDVYDPVSLNGTTCFHPDERAKYRQLIGLGLTDAFRAANSNKQQFSWWDYRGAGFENGKGMRIDHLLLSPEAADNCKGSDVDIEPRGWEKPSDHAPVWCELVFDNGNN